MKSNNMSNLHIIYPHLETKNWNSNAELIENLLARGCRACNLGFQENLNGCCVHRGKIDSKVMLIGEAPGKDEDSTRKPFTGPAGQLLDRIFASVGLDTNDFYMTNIALCRPIAPQQSGKQNLTPSVEQQRRCRPFLHKQIELLDPKLIITLGGVATKAILDTREYISVLRGYIHNIKLDNNKVYPIFPMYHPAAILHARKDPDKEREYKLKTWADIKYLKEILIKENLI